MSNLTNESKINKKGLAFTIEAIIAISMLVLAVAGMFTTLPESKISTTKYSAYAALAELDGSGELRQLVESNNATAIADRLEPWLEDFELEICDPACAGPSRPGPIAVEWFASGLFSLEPKRLRVYVYGQ